MRLINTSTGLFEEFIGSKIPKYAILSHTWEEEEVSFKAMTSDPSYRNMKGYQKIKMTSHIASQAGYSYAWVDTCCIDKSSSAELTEAINSMYRWYQRSGICYIFLSDLPASAHLDVALEECRWFTRGWTLQELIAPQNTFFFDQDWNCRGSKQDLVGQLSRITGINSAILLGSQTLSSVAVAQKMSWAAYRETTRVEDAAYCLLGIFDVNLPLLYGEEHKAFRRLQEEIIKTTADLSIFAWRMPHATKTTTSSLDRVYCGILAESPLYFAQCKSLSKLSRQARRDFSITNNGIKIQSRLFLSNPPARYMLPLNCFWDPKLSVGVRLRMCGPDQFVRDDPYTLAEYSDYLLGNPPRERFLLTELPEVDLSPGSSSIDMSLLIAQTRSHAIQIKTPYQQKPPYVWQVTRSDVWPQGCYDSEDQVFFVSEDPERDYAAMRFSTTLHSPQGQKLSFEWMFYALGWSSLDISQLKCTIVEFRSFSGALNDLQSRVFDWEAHRDQVSWMLAYHDLPKLSFASVKIPGTGDIAVVSFTPSLVSDPRVCRNSFWKVAFSFEVCKAKDVPKARSGKWN